MRVAWEGDFEGLHSLAMVNRALCRSLLERGHDLGLLQDAAGPAVGMGPSVPLDPRLAARLGRGPRGGRRRCTCGTDGRRGSSPLRTGAGC